MQNNKSQIKIGIVLSAYNRPEYLSRTLSELREKKFGIEAEIELVIIDDGSMPETEMLVNNFSLHNIAVFKIRMSQNMGIAKVLHLGWDLLAARKCNFLCNIDSDTLLKDRWLEALYKTYQIGQKDFKKNDILVSGFNTKNHPIKREHSQFVVKHSIGGINTFFPISMYSKYVVKAFKKGRDWDWALVKKLYESKVPIICTKPSVVQHIGLSGMSSINGFCGNNIFDMAEDF